MNDQPHQERDGKENEPATSPFSHPNVMTGYPLSPEEKRHVERLSRRDDAQLEKQH